MIEWGKLLTEYRGRTGHDPARIHIHPADYQREYDRVAPYLVPAAAPTTAADALLYGIRVYKTAWVPEGTPLLWPVPGMPPIPESLAWSPDMARAREESRRWLESRWPITQALALRNGHRDEAKTGTGPHACPRCGSVDIRFAGHSGDGDAWHDCNACGWHWDLPDSRAGAAAKPRWTSEQKRERHA